MKKALITGVTGQDGAYLTEYCLKKGYKVFIGLDKKIIQIKKNNDLIKLKKRKTVGYNLFATKAKEFMPHLNNG